MNIETLDNNKTQVALDQNNKQSRVAVILIPGASGKVFTDKYKILVDKCLASGLDFLRVQSWNNLEELGHKNIGQIQEDIREAIKFLRSNGYTKIFALGKSLGGGILLTDKYPEISKLVLWAPAIGITDNKGNLRNKIETTFSNINSMLDITVDEDLLSDIKIPVKIIHGTKDEIIPLGNSLKLSGFLPNSQVVKIDDMGHSAKTPEQEKELIDVTVDFLSKF